MGLTVSLLERMANSKWGTKAYKWATTPKGQNFLDNSLPTIESLFAVSMYTVSTERQDLDRRQKNLLHFQNWVPAIIGMGIGTYLNRQVSKLGDKIIKHLDESKIQSMHKTTSAIKVMLPIVTTMILMRLALPVVTAYASGKVEEKKAELKNKKSQELDLKA